MLFEATQVIILSVHHSSLTLLLDSKLCKHCCPLTFFLGKRVQLLFSGMHRKKIIVRKEQASLTFTLYLFLSSVLVL